MNDDLNKFYENITNLSDLEFEEYLKTISNGILVSYLLSLLDNKSF